MASQEAATPEPVARMVVDNGVDFPADPIGRVDFAWRSAGQLLVYGWILGLASGIRRATLDYGSFSVDLCGQAIRIPRPDVTRHYPSRSSADDNYHGFYVLVDLPDPQMAEAELRLFVTSPAGRSTESHWPVLPDTSQGMLDILKGLIRQVPQSEAHRLVAFAGLSPQMEADSTDTPTRFEVELCCIWGQRLVIVAGVLSNVRREISSIELALGTARFDVLGSSVPVSFLRKSSAPDPSSGSAAGFLFTAELTDNPEEAQAIFEIRTASQAAQLTRPLVSAAAEVRAQLLSFVGRLDPEGVILLTGRVRSLLEVLQVEPSVAAFLGVLHEQTMEQLPSAFQHTKPRIELHVDSGVRVGDMGMFVRGWFYAQPGAAFKVTCDCGSVTVDVSDRWIRFPRPDVTTYLANQAIVTANDDHGFLRFLELPRAQGQCHLTVTTTPTRAVRLARINIVERVSHLQAIHLLLRSFNNQGERLSALLDDPVGPAVAAIWARRSERAHDPVSRQFGSPAPDPQVSVIVVLQENWELSVEEQLASFASDPDFQREELIYVMEAPGSDVQLWRRCADLYDQHRVPFTMLCTGAETGFAGSSNCAARLARGARLLLLGCDVRPKRADWVAQMTTVYEKLEVPGVLGAKLLHGNGAVRDAGGEFRRRSEWGGLWDRYCPQEGQSAARLTGLREVEAVTAACMLIDAGLYRELGGLCEDYVQRDFADSDLCMQAALAGRRNRVTLDIELSQPQRSPGNVGWDALSDPHLRLYNCWLHQRRWAQLIGSRMQRVTTPGVSSAEPAPAG